MQKKVLGLLATTALSGGLMLASISPASAAHYCRETPNGIQQTNGNGARGGSDGWRNSTSGIQNAEEAGALEDCGTANPLPTPNSNKLSRGMHRSPDARASELCQPHVGGTDLGSPFRPTSTEETQGHAVEPAGPPSEARHGSSLAVDRTTFS